MDKLKIALAGPAGSGKSTVANLVSSVKGFPFLRAKDITTPILKRDGYDYSSGFQVEKFLQTDKRQLEIFAKTLSQQSGENFFITDRCMVDLAAYAIAGIDYLTAETLDEILYKAKTFSSEYDYVFLFKTGQLINNNKRTLNRHFQDMIYMLELGLLTEWDIPFIIIDQPVIDAQTKAGEIIKEVWK